MAILATTYYEAIDNDSRCTFSFDQTGGRGRCPYLVGKVPIGGSAGAPTFSPAIASTQQLQFIIEDIIGYTNYGTGTSQSLKRSIPVTHPWCPYLYANSISSWVGKGTRTAQRAIPVDPSDPTIGSKPIADYFLYETYELMVEFASRPYPILEDNAFTRTMAGTWYKEDGSSQSFNYAPEWCRYADFDLTPQDNTIQGSSGDLALRTSATTWTPFNSPPWMWLPDQLLKVKWYQVPYRYITSNNSYIAGGNGRQWRGKINQNTWWNWPAGSLLYLGYNVTKYTPPNNIVGTYPTYGGGVDYTTGAVTKSSIGTLKNYERLCDIELTFLLTDRQIGSSLGGTINNKNYIPAGHNLLPNLSDNKFYYATRPPRDQLTAGGASRNSIQDPPAWLSFPAEALFSDPDVAGGPT